MTLQLRVPTRVHLNLAFGGPWGRFIWGSGHWGDGVAHDQVTEMEPATRVLSAFSLQAYPFAALSRPWATFVWGVDGWGIPAVSSVVIKSGEPVTRIPTTVEGS